jgi:hypothetical protein
LSCSSALVIPAFSQVIPAFSQVIPAFFLVIPAYFLVIPAQAGTQERQAAVALAALGPACAGMTDRVWDDG